MSQAVQPTQRERSLPLIKSKPPEPVWMYLLISTLTAIGGIIIGWVYLVKDGAQNKRFGFAALLLGLLLPAVVLVIFVANQIQQTGSAPLPNQPGVLLPE